MLIYHEINVQYLLVTFSLVYFCCTRHSKIAAHLQYISKEGRSHILSVILEPQARESRQIREAAETLAIAALGKSDIKVKLSSLLLFLSVILEPIFLPVILEPQARESRQIKESAEIFDCSLLVKDDIKMELAEILAFARMTFFVISKNGI